MYWISASRWGLCSKVRRRQGSALGFGCREWTGWRDRRAPARQGPTWASAIPRHPQVLGTSDPRSPTGLHKVRHFGLKNFQAPEPGASALGYSKEILQDAFSHYHVSARSNSSTLPTTLIPLD